MARIIWPRIPLHGHFPVRDVSLPEGKPPFSHGFSYDFPIFPWVFLWFSYGFPIFPLVFLWFSYGIPLHGKNNSHNCAIGAAPELSPTTWI
jgi:hypothetical protein